MQQLNAFIASKGFSFKIQEHHVGTGFQNPETEGLAKPWFKAERFGETVVCWFGDWKTGEKYHFSEGPEDKATLRLVKAAQKQIEIERSGKAVQAKLQVEELWNRWKFSPTMQSDYLEAKGLGGHEPPAITRSGEEDAQRILVVPMFDADGELWNFQQIFRSGKKAFHPNARAKGLCHAIAGTNDLILIGEGYATCLAAYKATGYRTICAFSCSNMEAVCESAVKRYGHDRVVILADWDGGTFEKVGENPGMLMAQKLAVKFDVSVACPINVRLGEYENQNIDFADLTQDQIVHQFTDIVHHEHLRDKVFKKPKVKAGPKLGETLGEAGKSFRELLKDDLVRALVEPPLDAKFRPVELVQAPIEPVVEPLNAVVDYSYIVDPRKSTNFTPNYGEINQSVLPDVVTTQRGKKTLSTLPNFAALMRAVGATLRYNIITKDQEIFIPGEMASVDNYKSVITARIEDLCARTGFPAERISSYSTYLCDQAQFNPVAAWIESKPWDKVSRLDALYKTVKVFGEDRDETKREMKGTFIRKWMLMALASAYRPDGLAAPGMLVFQGPQYIGKTKWLLSLVPTELNLAVDGKIVDTRDKDSVKQTVCYWLVELGELDATFKKSDVAALKAFITRGRDMFRPAYARSECNFPRRTVFFGSVNHESFLADTTGNRRYWTLDVETVDWNHGLDMQQVWAELLVQYKAGKEWWLDDREMAWLNHSNQQFEVIDSIADRLARWFDWGSVEGAWKTAGHILEELGYDKASNGDIQKCAAAVKRLNGGRTDRQAGSGARVLWVPLKRKTF